LITVEHVKTVLRQVPSLAGRLAAPSPV
jgi:hypothetical protein